MKRTILLSIACLAGSVLNCLAQGAIEVTVSDIKSDKGKIILMLFDQADGFPSEKDVAFKRAKVQARNGEVHHTFTDLPYQTYALFVVHDENDNDEIDKNFVGFPKERIGASHQTGFGKPSFEKSKFTLSETQKVVEIKMEFVN